MTKRTSGQAKLTPTKFIGNPVTKAYRPNQGHCSGLLYSFKNGDQRPWRGILERDSMILWDVDPTVESFLVEPITIRYIMPDGKPSHYTPDRLVHFVGNRPSLLLEVKPKRKLRKGRARWKAKFGAATEEAKQRGWQFEVWTEEEVRGPGLENADFLRMFLAYTPDTVRQSRLLAELEQLGKTKISDLLSRVSVNQEDRAHLQSQLWQLLALHKIHADWRKLITIHSRVEVARQ